MITYEKPPFGSGLATISGTGVERKCVLQILALALLPIAFAAARYDLQVETRCPQLQ
jgi:hypothetical protein